MNLAYASPWGLNVTPDVIFWEVSTTEKDFYSPGGGMDDQLYVRDYEGKGRTKAARRLQEGDKLVLQTVSDALLGSNFSVNLQFFVKY